jgi:hypothetical protein
MGLGLIWTLILPHMVSAYEMIEVREGSVLAGRVTLLGQVPTPKGFNLITFPDPQYCGRISTGTGWRLLKDFSVDQTGGLKDVVVMLEGIEAGKPFELSVPRVEVRDCQFLPFVTIVRQDHAVEVVNMDPVLHDVQAYETSPQLGARVIFNSPLPMNIHHKRGDLYATHRHTPGQSMLEPVRLSKGRRFFVMQCGFHAYMESWAMAVQNPYYAITDETGHFSIEMIPPGTYRLVAWHPYAGPIQERIVVIGANTTQREQMSFQAPSGKRTAYEMVENPRFGPGALGYRVDIVPLVERQH